MWHSPREILELNYAHLSAQEKVFYLFWNGLLIYSSFFPIPGNSPGLVCTYTFHRRGKGYQCINITSVRCCMFSIRLTPTMISISSHLLFLFLDK